MMSTISEERCRTRRWWMEEEDKVLRREVEVQVKEGTLNDWNRIATHLPGRSNKDCRKRWSKICGNVKKGAWDAAEDRRLLAAVDKYGLCWTEVAQEVRTRHAEQCAKRWQNSLDPTIERKKWESDDDERLMQAVACHGRIWSKISDMEFPKRTATDIKNRHALLMRRRHSQRRDSYSEQVAPAAPDEDALGSSDDEDDRSSSSWRDDRSSDQSSNTTYSSPFSGIASPIPMDKQWVMQTSLSEMPPNIMASTVPPSAAMDQQHISWDTHSFDPADITHDTNMTHGLDGFLDMSLMTQNSRHASQPSLAQADANELMTGLAVDNPTIPCDETALSSSKITLTIQDAPSQTLTKILDTLYRDKAQYRLDVSHG